MKKLNKKNLKIKAEEYKKLPESPGVYMMKNRDNKVIYAGKAINLKRRVSGYFNRFLNERISKMVSEVKTIDYIKTSDGLHALILEAKIIKEKKPLYNIQEKDDKSFLYIEITKEKFPRVLLVREKSPVLGERFGPFTSAKSVREAMKTLRRIFPWNTHPQEKIGKFKKYCFDYELGLCPGVCVRSVSSKNYMKNIQGLKMFLSGKREKVLLYLQKEMALFAKKLNFEEADRIKKRIFALNHIQDIYLITDDKNEFIFNETTNLNNKRIEGFDISNISGDFAVGSMVVFTKGIPDKKEYRKFKIRLTNSINDAGMIKEIIKRRLNNDWELPSVILVDGGPAQVNAAKTALKEKKIEIPVIGMIKGKNRKGTDLTGDYVPNMDKKILERVSAEAHRFAINYHKNIRQKNFLKR